MRAPAIDWPTEFREMGPSIDPSIMLVGDARIAGTDYVVTAIRMNEDQTGPDYRDGIDEEIYESVIDELFDDIEFLTETIEPALLHLAGGQYLLWMAPADLE